MKRFLYTLWAMMLAVCVHAQIASDSVRIRLRTSNGAEISVDGDLSSTNVMDKKVSAGKHTVVVNFGSNYSKTYEINVEKGGPAEFDFFIDGQLVVKSTPPNADVIIDGLPQGKTPVTINLLGQHNVQILGNSDLYFPHKSTIEVLPEQEVNLDAILSKRPPKLYGFVVANYMLSANAPGLMFGLGRRFGVYARVNVALNGLPDYQEDELRTHNKPITSDEYEKKPKYFGAVAGLTMRLTPSLFAYAGGGYGEYTHGSHCGIHSYPQDVYHVNGAEIDCGIMLKYKALLLQAGYTRMLDSGDVGKFGEFNFGIGITIHKEKKR